jgi:hypothetical protein
MDDDMKKITRMHVDLIDVGFSALQLALDGFVRLEESDLVLDGLARRAWRVRLGFLLWLLLRGCSTRRLRSGRQYET